MQAQDLLCLLSPLLAITDTEEIWQVYLKTWFNSRGAFSLLDLSEQDSAIIRDIPT